LLSTRASPGRREPTTHDHIARGDERLGGCFTIKINAGGMHISRTTPGDAQKTDALPTHYDHSKSFSATPATRAAERLFPSAQLSLTVSTIIHRRPQVGAPSCQWKLVPVAQPAPGRQGKCKPSLISRVAVGAEFDLRNQSCL